MIIENPILENSDNNSNVPVVHEDITHEEVSNPIVFKQAFTRVSKLSLQMTASYTFSFQMVFLVYLLSQLDDDEDNLAAITLITSFITTVVMIGISPLLPMSLIAGHEIGALHDAELNAEDEHLLQSRRERIAAVHRNGLFISAGMLPIMTSCMVFSKPILTDLFYQNEDVATIASKFIQPYAIALPGIMLRICSEQLMFSFGRTKAAMLIGLTNFTFCMSIGSLFTFGSLGLPRLGTTGLLIACIAESYLTAVAYSVYIAQSPRFKSFNFFDLMRPIEPHLAQLKKILKISKFNLFAMTVECTMDLTTSVLAGVVGTQEQAALSATMQFSLLTLLLQAAFGQSCSQEMSRELGQNHFSNVSHLGKFGLITSLMFTTPIPLTLAAYPAMLLPIIGEKNQETREILHYLAPIIFLGNIMDSARYNMVQQLRVLGDSRRSSVVSSACLTLGMSTSALLGLKTDLGIYGVAAGYSFGITLATASIFYRWINRIDSAVIEKNKNNPEVKPKLANYCSFFFKMIPNRIRSNTEIGTEMKESTPTV